VGIIGSARGFLSFATGRHPLVKGDEVRCLGTAYDIGFNNGELRPVCGGGGELFAVLVETTLLESALVESLLDGSTSSGLFTRYSDPIGLAGFIGELNEARFLGAIMVVGLL